VVLPLLRGDLRELCTSTAHGVLGQYLQGFSEGAEGMPADWEGAGITRWDRHCVVVVGASDGYPGHYLAGRPNDLPGDDTAERWLIHAGTAWEDGQLVSSGGRVLGAVGLGEDLSGARRLAYDLLAETHFEGLTYRRDIGAPGGKNHG
jgi:phosphoribosylamine--glycine ligase